MFRLKNKLLSKLSGPFIYGKWSKTTRKQFFSSDFSFRGHLGTPNGPKKVPKGMQVGGIYGPMSQLENNPLNKLLGPFI